MAARPSCLRLLRHWVRAAASRAFCTAGNSKPIKSAMTAITTSSSTSVNPRRRLLLLIWLLLSRSRTDRWSFALDVAAKDLELECSRAADGCCGQLQDEIIHPDGRLG